MGELLVGALLCGGVWGCGDNLVGAPPDGFTAPAPGAVDPRADYPEAPPSGYGARQGDILPDMRFAGFFTEAPSPVQVGELEHLDSITLGDIRALDGYTHLLITVAAEWCKPCREEAEILPELFESWSQRGGYVLGIINQDRNYNSAGRRSVESWARRYQTNYTLTHDPEGFVANAMNPSTVPLNVVVDLETMEVLRSRAGEDPDTFLFFESLLQP